jgi:hypothetical protein
MKSVKLVYNGDLARSIEDWVKDKVQVGGGDLGLLGRGVFVGWGWVPGGMMGDCQV